VKTRGQGAVWGAGIAVVAVGIWVLSRRVQFDWASFAGQLRDVAWVHVAIGVALIYAGLWMRLVRWSVLCAPDAGSGSAVPVSGSAVPASGLAAPASGLAAPARLVRPMALLGPMSIGFTAVAMFGRLADLVRPYLIARRLERTLSSQVAVYTIERMLDLGAAATVFSCALAFTPRGLAHREWFVRVGVGSLLATAVIAMFAVAVRIKGDAVARGMRGLLRRVSPGLGGAVEEKILGFREGLLGIRTAGEFGLAAVLSVGLWGLIGAAYWQTLHAFAGRPELAELSFSRAMLLMAVSLSGSLLQLPVVGWFTQVAVLATAMHGFYGAPVEAATACGALLLVVTSLCILPAGLFFAWKDGVSLRSVAEDSGAAGRAAAGE